MPLLLPLLAAPLFASNLQISYVPLGPAISSEYAVLKQHELVEIWLWNRGTTPVSLHSGVVYVEAIRAGIQVVGPNVAYRLLQQGSQWTKPKIALTIATGLIAACTTGAAVWGARTPSRTAAKIAGGCGLGIPVFKFVSDRAGRDILDIPPDFLLGADTLIQIAPGSVVRHRILTGRWPAGKAPVIVER